MVSCVNMTLMNVQGEGMNLLKCKKFFYSILIELFRLSETYNTFGAVSSDPCQNNGACTDLINSYNCTCNPGYVGVVCETDFNECYRLVLIEARCLIYYMYCFLL